MSKTKKENLLVVGNRSWADTLPESLLDDIKSERTILGLISIVNPNFTDDEKVGDVEAIAYLMPASLAAPLPHTLTQIYLYLVTKVMERKGIPQPYRPMFAKRNYLKKRQES